VGIPFWGVLKISSFGIHLGDSEQKQSLRLYDCMEPKEKDKKPIINCLDDGPYAVENVDRVVNSNGRPLSRKAKRMLCRCGRTKYQPFCDGTHIEIGFKSRDGSKQNNYYSNDDYIGEKESDMNSGSTIFIEKNGPCRVQGGITLVNGKKEDRTSDENYSLCRCGESKKKPFCDSTHQAIGFRDDGLICIGNLSQLDSELTRVTINRKELVIVKQKEILSVLSGLCLHAEALMAEGFIDGPYLTCGKHLWRYELETGVLDGDPTMGLKKMAHRIEEDNILIKTEELNALKIAE